MGVGRFSDEFIENRRRALEKFLNRVAAHHELQTDNRFQAFLESNEVRQWAGKTGNPTPPCSCAVTSCVGLFLFRLVLESHLAWFIFFISCGRGARVVASCMWVGWVSFRSNLV